MFRDTIIGISSGDATAQREELCKPPCFKKMLLERAEELHKEAEQYELFADAFEDDIDEETNLRLIAMYQLARSAESRRGLY